jgi:hypothetical protein
MVHYEKDAERGRIAQHEIFPIVKAYFTANYELEGEMVENLEEYDKYDYECDNAVFEVKSRFDIEKNTFKTTMMTCNKVTETEKGIFFIFNFTDQINYIIYEEELFNTFEKKMYSRAGIKTDEKDHWYIPIQHLQTIHIKPSKCLISIKKK